MSGKESQALLAAFLHGALGEMGVPKGASRQPLPLAEPPPSRRHLSGEA